MTLMRYLPTHAGPARPRPRGTAALVALRSAELGHVEAWLAGIANDNTRAAYAADLGAWVAWLDAVAEGRPWSLLDATDVAAGAWVTAMTAEGLAPSTIARRQAALASFYRWAVRRGGPIEGARNPWAPDAVRRVRSTSTHTGALDGAEVGRLLDAARHGPHPERDTALVALLATTGARVTEVCAARWADLSPSTAGAELTLMGKGRKVRKVPLAPAVVAALGPAPADLDRPLLLGNDGGPLDRHKVGRILTRLARAASIGRAVTPHVLRATAITESLEAGAALWAVQDLAGHSDPRTTRGYHQRRQAAAQRAAIASTLWARYDTHEAPAG